MVPIPPTDQTIFYQYLIYRGKNLNFDIFKFISNHSFGPKTLKYIGYQYAHPDVTSVHGYWWYI